MPKLIASDQRSGSDRRSLSITLTLSLTLPDLNLTIFPSIPCLVSGRRSEPKLSNFDPGITSYTPISLTGAPAGFQNRVGKHLFDKIRRTKFRLATLVFSLPTLSYVTVAHPDFVTNSNI